MSNKRRREAGRITSSRAATAPTVRDRAADGAKTVLRASDPADLLAVVPYLMGYQPRDSLVLVVVAQQRLQLCARLDLALAAHPAVLLERVRSIVTSQQAETVLLAAYGAAEACRPVVSLVMTELAEPPTVTVIEALYTDGDRWWSLSCSGPCCPIEGTAYDLRSNRLAAEAVWAGLGMVGDREQIADSVAGPPESVRRELRARSVALTRTSTLRSLSERRAQVAELVGSALEQVRSPGGRLDVEQCLQLAVLVGDIAVRDVAWSFMTRAEARDHVAVWQQVVGVCVPELACPALCLLGCAAWISGNGTLQVCCLERAERLDPAYTLAGLLADLNDRAAPPSLWDEIGPALRDQLDPDGSGAADVVITGGRS